MRLTDVCGCTETKQCREHYLCSLNGLTQVQVDRFFRLRRPDLFGRSKEAVAG